MWDHKWSLPHTLPPVAQTSLKFSTEDFQKTLLGNSNFQLYWFILKLCFHAAVYGLFHAAYEPLHRLCWSPTWKTLTNLHFNVSFWVESNKLQRTLLVILCITVWSTPLKIIQVEISTVRPKFILCSIHTVIPHSWMLIGFMKYHWLMNH
jgi:hypothetical protein